MNTLIFITENQATNGMEELTMPKVSEYFGGSYLKADHLNGQPRVVTINGWNNETSTAKRPTWCISPRKNAR